MLPLDHPLAAWTDDHPAVIGSLPGYQLHWHEVVGTWDDGRPVITHDATTQGGAAFIDPTNPDGLTLTSQATTPASLENDTTKWLVVAVPTHPDWPIINLGWWAWHGHTSTQRGTRATWHRPHNQPYGHA